MVGILLSHWGGLFSGATLVSGRVIFFGTCVCLGFGRLLSFSARGEERDKVAQKMYLRSHEPLFFQKASNRKVLLLDRSTKNTVPETNSQFAPENRPFDPIGK